MEYKIVKASTVTHLVAKVNEEIQNGFKPIGSHQVVTKSSINRYAGTQLRDTVCELEYSQTMMKE